MSQGLEAILAYKPVIDKRLQTYLTGKKRKLSAVNSWAEDVIDRLMPFATSGKTVRGSLVLYTYRLFEKSTPSFVLDAAAALELLHSGLLIHDDIMDRDRLRRGKPSLFAQYETLARQNRQSDAAHFGISQAINAADLCYFLGYDLLSGASHTSSELLPRVNHELSSVVIAQMQDVYGSIADRAFTEAEILALYRYKTARYSFSLPFTVGALLAKQSPKVIDNFITLGEHIGLLYQLRDDALNAAGDEKVTGKSVGSDAREHKQTYLAWLRTTYQERAQTLLQQKMQELFDRAKEIIHVLPITAAQQKSLIDLATFSLRREK